MDIRTSWRTLPAALVATCALTGTAQAARVDSTDGLLRYTAEPGERTNADVRIDGDAIRVQEFPSEEGQPANPLLPSGECQPAEPNVVRCQLGRGEVRIDMGVGNLQRLTIDDRLFGRIEGGQQLDDVIAGPLRDSLAEMRLGPLSQRTTSPVPEWIAAARPRLARAANLSERTRVAGRPGRGFIIDGNGGEDIIAPGRGDDTIEVGPGKSWLYPGYGADRVDGGPDRSLVLYDDHTGDVTVDLRDTRPVQGERGERDQLVNIDGVIGGQGRNRLTGDDRSNFLSGDAGTGGELTGLGGHDTMFGTFQHAGGMRMLGGSGEDSFVPDDGPDVIDGGPAGDIDTVGFDVASADLRIDMPSGRAVGSDGVVDRFAGIEWVGGGLGNDELIGDAGNNVLHGGLFGNDRIVGGAGSDDLLGGFGDDDLDAVDGAFDFVSCGEPFEPGVEDRDRARVDSADGVEPDCEEVVGGE